LGVARDTLPLGEGTLTTAAYKGVQLSREGLQIELEDGQPVPLSLEAEAHRDAFEPHPKLARGQLCLHDTNPLWSLEEHPGKHGNATDLGGKEVGEWQRALDAALALIEVALPSLFAELESTLRRVVPVGYDSQRHLSASYTEAPGLIYMTLHPDPLTLAEAIIHETQHGKLNAVLWHDRVLHNGRSEWTTSPVRDDLRPLMGVLLAVHAFVPVSSLHAALAELDHPISQTNAFRLRRENVLASNADGLRTLYRLGQWTDLGARLRDAMTRMQDANVLRAPLPTPPQATA
jgi:HEXXH motif-containing protein